MRTISQPGGLFMGINHQMPYNVCALIPTFNHYQALPGIVRKLIQSGLKVIIVDDGSQMDTQVALQKLIKDIPDIQLKTLSVNQGKGAAIEHGLRLAAQLGYSHALQVDADGQHNLDNLVEFLQLSADNPQALVSGQPVYDQSMPWSRKIGRWVTHVWVWIETLSFRITDSMCGFRIYPIHETLELYDQRAIGKRMDFDTEIMVRLFWAGTPVLMSPVHVSYPEGNLSNFDVLADNWRITKMHTKLVFGMLGNLPKILANRPCYKNLNLTIKATPWASVGERGSLAGLYFLATCYRLLGKRACMILGSPIIFFLYLKGSVQRQASQEFLGRVHGVANRTGPTFGERFRHFMNFFEMALDKFAAWTGHLDMTRVDPKGREQLSHLMKQKTGGVLLVSHLGNMEFCRATACSDHKNRLHLLLHTKNSKRFHRLLQAYNPQSHINLIEVTDVGPDTILFLRDRIQAGDWVVIAGDRVPVSDNQRISLVPFLGQDAPFSDGPYILASLLECPVYTAFAVKEDKIYHIYLEPFSERIVLSRKNRQSEITDLACKYAQVLERYAIKYPTQWFNFFDFWKQHNRVKKR
jgi:predicted LPLAT superfamily acyltransferase